MKWIALSRTSISKLMFSLHLSSNNFLSNNFCIALFMSMVIGLPALFFLTSPLASTACIDRVIFTIVFENEPVLSQIPDKPCWLIADSLKFFDSRLTLVSENQKRELF